MCSILVRSTYNLENEVIEFYIKCGTGRIRFIIRSGHLRSTNSQIWEERKNVYVVKRRHDKKQKLGARKYYLETIRQQPELWHETFDRLSRNSPDLDRLFNGCENNSWRATDPRLFFTNRGPNLSTSVGIHNSVSY